MIFEIIKIIAYAGIGALIVEYIHSKDFLEFFDTGYEIGYTKGLEESESVKHFTKKLNIKQCSGEGQGSCKRCTDKGIWNTSWMCFLYEIEGMEGCYCEKCVKEIVE